MTKILVTGASGFIGKHLIPQLNKSGYELFTANSASGDVIKDSTWLNFPKADIVIHLAGKSFVPDSWIDPTGFIKCNLLGAVGAMNYCKKNNARLIILSSYLYGNPERLPIAETAPLVATNPYALSKKLAEEACEFYAENFNVRITILRPFNVYGPDQPVNFLIPAIINQVISGKSIHVKDLEPKRDYVYVNDLVNAILKVIHIENPFGVFNIGSGYSYSVAELISIIQNIKGTNLPVYSDGERRKEEIMNTVADISKAKLILGWEPQWPLVEGLTQILNLEGSHNYSEV